MSKFHIVAGALAVFFLTVASAKSMMQAARKRRAKRESIERSKSGENVSLHNPYPGAAPFETPSDEADNAEESPDNAPKTAKVQKTSEDLPAQQPKAEQAPPQEQVYKWN